LNRLSGPHIFPSIFCQRLRPSTSSFDFSRAFSTFLALPQLSSTFEFVGFNRFLLPFLPPSAHFPDLARAYSNWFYLLQPFTSSELARFGSSTSFDGSISTQVGSNSLRSAPGSSVSPTIEAEGQKGREREKGNMRRDWWQVDGRRK
jgi:hypothetical protein